jgi:N-acetylmuramoyl-L-alanine amidase
VIKIKFWQWVLGLCVATICITGSWTQVTVAQSSQPSVCSDRLLQPVTDNLAIAPVYAVTKDLGIARTGPHDDCKRVTPLPKGTRARVIAEATGPDRSKKTVPWSQLDYGAWIESSELVSIGESVPLQSQLASVSTQISTETTEITFPLSSPVPIEVQQGDRTFSLTFHHTIGNNIKNLSQPSQPQIWQPNQSVNFTNPVLAQGSWQKIAPDKIRFDFRLKPRQQWGYQIRYVGNSFVLSLRKPPVLTKDPNRPLQGVKIMVDPGHGGNDSGAVGKLAGTSFQEKTLNIQFSELLQQELQRRGANVTMTRTNDVNPSLDDRQIAIDRLAPAVSISIHHDATASGRGTKGSSIYWYHPQSQDLAASLLDYFTQNGNRPILNDNGVIQKSFAVARPSVAPAVLLEVGFMTDPDELTELSNPDNQERLAKVLADGISQWVVTQSLS